VQRTRIAAINAYQSSPPAMQPAILRDLLVILFHSVTPPGELTALRATDKPLADPQTSYTNPQTAWA